MSSPALLPPPVRSAPLPLPLPERPDSSLPAFGAGLASAVLHLGCVLALAIWTSAPNPPNATACIEVGVRDDPPPAVDELAGLTFEAPAATELQAFATLSPEEPAGDADLTQTEVSAEFDDFAFTSHPTLVESVAGLPTDAAEPSKAMPQGGAEFYGIRSAGDRFVYVVDCSTSMEGPKWREARREVIDSLKRLGAGRYFFVILFDGSAHSMFGLADYQKTMLAATDENIAKCDRWMDSQSLGDATSPFAAIKHALSLQPNAIFLLTDGEFIDPTADYLRRTNVRKEKGKRVSTVAVHTIGFFTRKGQSLLKGIARENGGEFQFVSREHAD